jgi:hypothetical protein
MKNKFKGFLNPKKLKIIKKSNKKNVILFKKLIPI